MRTALLATSAGSVLMCLFLAPSIGCRTGRLVAVIASPVADRPVPVASTIETTTNDVAGSASSTDIQSRSGAGPVVTHLPPIQPVAFAQAVDEEIAPPLQPMCAANSLELEPLIAQVLALNPGIQAATAAWRAAAERYPQEISLDDPMFGYMLGPASWGSDQVKSAYTLEGSQKLPWPGKRRLRGNMANAEANAAYFDVGEQRLQIAEATRIAYYEYYLAHRQLAVLDESTQLLQGFREIALRKFESAEAEQQDVLLADVELAELERRRLELVRSERVARARINTLLLVPAQTPLPPPPQELEMRGGLPTADELLRTSLSQRPELAARQARIRREQYAAALAHKEFFPDMELVARYDAFWQEEPLRPMIGMNVNVPMYTDKRWAALREANARRTRERAELDAQIQEISFQVEQAYQRVEESVESLDVYNGRILPAARHSVESAQASYTAGRLDFLRLVESQRQLLALEDEYYEDVAEYHRRLAELDRQIGVEFTDDLTH